MRINSEGVKLNQADFIPTLLSVFWDEDRHQLEQFCRASRQPPKPGSGPSAFNHFIQPDPDQLLRVSVALGFNRGRLKSIYQMLRGKDLETGVFSADCRDAQFKILQEAQAKVLYLTHWHQFFSALIGAGFHSEEMISSFMALVYAYAFYLIGRTRFSVPEPELQKVIGRWFFFSNLTSRYSSSPESAMDGDLNRIKGISDAKGFVMTLDDIIFGYLTNDFWTITLPSALDSSSARNPELFAYVAAQNRLSAPVLFSHKKVNDLLDPTIQTPKKALERHHLFPRAWLERIGVTDLKLINQMGNYALLEWPQNVSISDDAPEVYLPKIKCQFMETDWQKMNQLHAMPPGWETMTYENFLTARRSLMAEIIRQGFETLK